MCANLHVSREWQFVKCQAAFRLYSPSSSYAIEDERVRGGSFLKALRATPFEDEKDIKKSKG